MLSVSKHGDRAAVRPFKGWLVAGVLPAAVMLAVTVASPPPVAAREIVKDDIAALLERFDGARHDSFRDFAAAVRARGGNPALARSIARFTLGGALDQTDRINLYRLLGVYVRIKHRDDLIRTLGELVAIPTDKADDRPQHLNPGVHRLGVAIRDIARGFGLGWRNVDDRIFEVTLKGSGDESVGVFSHGDTVPADAAKWVLDDGRRLAPLALTVIGDRMYGRGASDNKSAIAVALHAMGAIKRAGFTLRRSIRLMIETTEETGGQATEYYKAHNALPAYNIVTDGRYPVGVAEKGFGVVMAKFPLRAGTGVTAGAEIVAATGGLAVNQIPSRATATITTPDTGALKAALDRAATGHVAANGANFRIENTTAPGRVTVTVFGQSTHSARPGRGVNPVSRLFDFLHAARRATPFKANHFTDAAAYVADNWGLDYLGSKLGLAFSDPFMGPFTAAVTQVKVKDGALRLAVNPRAPRGREPDALVARIRRGLEAWARLTGTEVSFDITINRYMYRDPKGPWIATMLDIFRDVTGIDAKPGSSAGYTTAHQLPNGVQFGPGMPGARGTAHRANEYKRLSDFLRDAQMVTEVMLRLGTLPSME